MKRINVNEKISCLVDKENTNQYYVSLYEEESGKTIVSIIVKAKNINEAINHTMKKYVK